LRQLSHKPDYSVAQQRLSAGDSNFLDPHPSEDARHAQVVREWQIAVESAFIAGAAIDTLVVATIGDRNPQIGDGAAEFVGKKHAAISIQRSAVKYSSRQHSATRLNAEC